MPGLVKPVLANLTFHVPSGAHAGPPSLWGLPQGGPLASGLGFRLGFRVEGLGWYSPGIWS